MIMTENDQQLTLFYNMLIDAYGKEKADDLMSDMPKKRVVSFRVNTLKANQKDVEHALFQAQISYEKVTWYQDAYVVFCEEKQIEALDIYHKGMIYLQSLSSMIPPLIMEPMMHEDILDMAASPGGKTTQMAALSQNHARLTVTEAHKIRAEKLKFNLNKQGVKNATLIIKDARQLDDFFSFDKILLDAPCSGTGTFCLDEQRSYQSFSKELIQKSVKLQNELLQKAIKLLKPGHTLIYSTCSILPIENEDQIKKILKSHPVELISIDHTIYRDLPLLKTDLEGTLLIQPTSYYEGFFVAKLRKKLNKK